MMMVRRFASELVERNPLLAYVAGAHLLLFIVLIPALVLDPFQILGISRWIKPMKFAISIAIFLATMGWLLAYLVERPLAARIVSSIAAFTMTAEMILITMQSSRGVQSHFNHATPFDDAVFGMMGMLILLNMIAVAYAAYLFFRARVELTPAHLAGIRAGIVIFILAAFEAGFMIRADSHGIGVTPGGPGLPFTNWSTTGGDLRVAHFFGMHSLQGLPLLGWFLDRRRVANGRVWVWIVAGIWLVVTVGLVLQALSGRPLVRLT
jgi:hypothetical protein